MAKTKTERITTVGDILAATTEIAPPHLAESWDNVGLQIGRRDAAAGRVMVALEVTRDVVKEAVRRKVGTLVTHHPLLFRPLKTLVEETSTVELAAELMRANVALIAAHTNLDSVAHGTNGELADRLGLQGAGRRFLRPVPADRDKVNYVVFVPKTHVDVVIEAIARAGAGQIGAYSHCTFRAPGTGTFKPLDGADPYLGTVGELEQAEEVRLECVCAKHHVQRLLTEVRAVHPYETIAFHLYDMDIVETPVAGLGLIGNLVEKTTLADLVKRAKKALGINSVGVVGDLKKKVQSVALCSGAGGEFIRTWSEGTADVFVTGEMTHHDCAEAYHRGVPVLLVGHWASEAIFAPRFAGMIQQSLAERGLTADVVVSEKETNPLQRM